MLQCYVLTCGRSVTAFLAPPRSQRPGQGPHSPHPKAGPEWAFGLHNMRVISTVSARLPVSTMSSAPSDPSEAQYPPIAVWRQYSPTLTDVCYNFPKLYPTQCHMRSSNSFVQCPVVRGSNPGDGQIFRTPPDRPCGLPSLLYNGHLVSFPRVKRPGVGLTTHLHLASMLKKRVELCL
jgi:hypothetical protein